MWDRMSDFQRDAWSQYADEEQSIIDQEAELQEEWTELRDKKFKKFLEENPDAAIGFGDLSFDPFAELTPEESRRQSIRVDAAEDAGNEAREELQEEIDELKERIGWYSDDVLLGFKFSEDTWAPPGWGWSPDRGWHQGGVGGRLGSDLDPYPPEDEEWLRENLEQFEKEAAWDRQFPDGVAPEGVEWHPSPEGGGGVWGPPGGVEFSPQGPQRANVTFTEEQLAFMSGASQPAIAEEEVIFTAEQLAFISGAPQQTPGVISSEPAVAEDRVVDPEVSQILTAQDQDSLKASLREVISRPITDETVNLQELISLAETAQAPWVQSAVEPSKDQQAEIDSDLERVSQRKVSSRKIQNKWNQWNRDLIAEGSYPMVLPDIPPPGPSVSLQVPIPSLTVAPTTTPSPGSVLASVAATGCDCDPNILYLPDRSGVPLSDMWKFPPIDTLHADIPGEFRGSGQWTIRTEDPRKAEGYNPECWVTYIHSWSLECIVSGEQSKSLPPRVLRVMILMARGLAFIYKSPTTRKCT